MTASRGITEGFSSKADDRYFRFVLTDAASNVEVTNWSVVNEELGIDDGPTFKVWKKTLHGGRQEGSTVVGIEAGELSVVVLPTRGMSLYKAHFRGVEFGWTSPVEEIVHPSFVNLNSRSGLGWLDGFNELLVRCGVEWSGHPCTEGANVYTLHGRAGNTPASEVIVTIERESPHRITLAGVLKEQTFNFTNLEVHTELVVTPGQGALHIRDRIVNKSDNEHPYQIIYHTNFGRPLLAEGARFVAPVKRVVPFDEHASQKLKAWQTYAAPTRGFAEELFACKLFGDFAGNTQAALFAPSRDRGVALSFNLDELPCFTLWKNTNSDKQGYVTGLEPGSNYPYSRVIENANGRLKKLGPEEMKLFNLEIQFLSTTPEVSLVDAKIGDIQAGRVGIVEPAPFAD